MHKKKQAEEENDEDNLKKGLFKKNNFAQYNSFFGSTLQSIIFHMSIYHGVRLFSFLLVEKNNTKKCENIKKTNING